MISNQDVADPKDAFLEGAEHWAKLGFQADPYYGHQLPVNAISPDLLVGRQEDRHRLNALLMQTRFSFYLAFISILLLTTGCATIGSGPANSAATARDPNTKVWLQLFNGKNLDGWDVKFTRYPLNENLNNTFRVEDGLLKVSYDKWTSFNGEFGHAFYSKRPFSHYVVAVEYRFTGEQIKGGPKWAIRNNGIMVHSQPAASMALNQDFPISLEVQLLGRIGPEDRTTGNLCTPGTHVVMNDKLITQHCIKSSSGTYDASEWVRVEALVLGDSIIKHIVNGDTVLTYSKPQMGGKAETTPGTFVDGKAIVDGYIALQAETAPIEFRKVELLNLVGCMDPKASNYKAYYVKADQAACQ